MRLGNPAVLHPSPLAATLRRVPNLMVDRVDVRGEGALFSKLQNHPVVREVHQLEVVLLARKAIVMGPVEMAGRHVRERLRRLIHPWSAARPEWILR